MPYKLRKAPKRELYWVITIETGKKHSKDPIPKEKAKAQMRILESALKGNGKVYLQKLGQLRNEHTENEAKIKREHAKMLKYAQDEDVDMLDVLSLPISKKYKSAISERERIKKDFQYWRSIQLKEEQSSIQEVEEEPEVERPPGTEAANSGLSAIRMLRKKKGGKNLRGKGDEGEDDEMARLMEPPPIAPPPPRNPFAGFLEPRMLRVRARRPARKRAISMVQGALLTNAEKRQKTGQGKRLRGGINKEKYMQIANSYVGTLSAGQLIKMYRDVVKVLTPEQIKLVRNQFGENFFEILEEILHDIETEFNKENYGRFKTIDGIEQYFIINAESKIRNFIAFIRKILFDNEDERVSFPPQPSRGRGLRGGITINEFSELLQDYLKKYTIYYEKKEKTEEDLQKMLKNTKKFINILKSNLNTNQWNNPRLMQLIDLIYDLETNLIKKSKNGEKIILDNDHEYTEIIDLIDDIKMDGEVETDILANNAEHVGKPTRNPPKEFPPVPVKRLSKGDGKNYCKKCGLPR